MLPALRTWARQLQQDPAVFFCCWLQSVVGGGALWQSLILSADGRMFVLLHQH